MAAVVTFLPQSLGSFNFSIVRCFTAVEDRAWLVITLYLTKQYSTFVLSVGRRRKNYFSLGIKLFLYLCLAKHGQPPFLIEQFYPIYRYGKSAIY